LSIALGWTAFTVAPEGSFWAVADYLGSALTASGCERLPGPTRRDVLAAKMSAALEGAAFHGQPINERSARSMITAGETLLDQARHLAK
jgi:hypothetical protein